MHKNKKDLSSCFDLKKYQTTKGFSIIELMVVIFIMIIMTAVLFAKQGERKIDTDVEVASRMVASQIRTLQNEALAGKKIQAQYINEFHFALTSLSGGFTTTYEISYKNSTGTYDTQSFDIAAKKVKFKSAVDPFDFYFKSPRGDVSAAQMIQITSKDDDTISKYICISSAGSIVEQDTDVCP